MDWFVGRVEAYEAVCGGGEALQSQIFVRNRLCIPVCKLRIDLSYQYAGEEKKRKERLWIAVRAK